jgi:tetratricopeptide (TPR) repeat protein
MRPTALHTTYRLLTAAMISGALVVSVRAADSLLPTLPEPDKAKQIVAELKVRAETLSAEDSRRLAAAYLSLERHAAVEEVLAGARPRYSADCAIALLAVEAAVRREAFVSAVTRLETFPECPDFAAARHLLWARAYLGLNQPLGTTEVRKVRGGGRGQLDGNWLVVAPVENEPHQFLCSRGDGALYHAVQAVRLAAPTIETLSVLAEAWSAAGYPEVGLAILQHHADGLPAVTPAYRRLMARLARDGQDVARYLALVRELAVDEAEGAVELLSEAQVFAAERFARRGEERLYLRLLERAVALQPERAAWRAQLAGALWDAGDRAEAARHYQVLLGAEPAPGRAAEFRARLEEFLAAPEESGPGTWRVEAGAEPPER